MLMQSKPGMFFRAALLKNLMFGFNNSFGNNFGATSKSQSQVLIQNRGEKHCNIIVLHNLMVSRPHFSKVCV